MSGWSSFTWAILAALCWGVAPIVEKLGLGGRVEPNAAVVVRSLGVLLGAAPLLLMPDLLTQVRRLDWRQAGFLVAGGVLASILGQVCFYRALKAGDVSRVVPIGASYPVLAFLLGVLFLNETVTPVKIAGLVLVLSGVYLLH